MAIADMDMYSTYTVYSIVCVVALPLFTNKKMHFLLFSTLSILSILYSYEGLLKEAEQ